MKRTFNRPLVHLLQLILILFLPVSCIKEDKAEMDDFSRKVIHHLLAKDLETLHSMFYPEIIKKEEPERLGQVVDFLDQQGGVLSIELVNYVYRSKQKLGWDSEALHTRHDLLYEMQFERSAVTLLVVLIKEEGVTYVAGLNLNQIPMPLSSYHDFNFTGKKLRHYVIFSGMFVIPAFILYAVYLCLKTDVERKWLWIIFILLGFSQIAIDWTSGALDASFLSVNILGVGFMRTGKGPWILAVSFPIGAIIFLMHRRVLMVKKAMENQTDNEQNEPAVSSAEVFDDENDTSAPLH
jgi:hypothetical protein